MHYDVTKIRSAEDLPNYPGVEHEALPLGFDPVRVKIEATQIGSIRLFAERFQSSIWYQEVQTSDLIYFGLILPLGDPVRFNATIISKPSLVSWIGSTRQETDHVITGGTLNYMVEISADVALKRGWQRVPPRIMTVNRHAALEFASALDSVFATARQRRIAATTMSEEYLLDSLDALTEDALYLNVPADRTRRASAMHQKVVAAAFDHMREEEFSGSDLGAELSGAIGTSRRTLYAAFKSHLGIGPSELHRIKRLYMLRRRLVSASPDETSVSSAMLESGFAQLGRTATLYRAHFGELPSKTLQRLA